MPERARLNLNDTFQPEDVYARLIPGEEKQIEIRLAWYRDILGHLVLYRFRLLLLITIMASLVILIFSFLLPFTWVYTLIPIGVLFAIIILGGLERFDYLQYRLLKTNARLIISIPQHGAWPLVDNIELKGAPSILDTNWSPNPIWRVFQFITGARDLYISMSGLQFVEGRAKVRDALIIPDIMPEDVFELKKLVFQPK
ncbi:MAG: hypothetical protein KC419_15875 [Anaerolineales bacterium]|nr:hypothetical protein [Anaerolineales bacterium]MCA9929963.1 hypothetical protein [Anaerolineales bacterium]